MTEPPSTRRPIVLIFFLLGLITMGLYWPAIPHEFVNYDDPLYVTDNAAVTSGLSSQGVVWAFTSLHATNWHPITWLSHMLDCHFFGLDPTGHHLTSVLLHVINTLLLFYLLHRITAAVWRSAFVALLFAIHPLHVESVAWISERKDVLSGFFFLLTVLAYTRYVEESAKASGGTENPSRITHHASRFYLLALLWFALGLMAKPMLVTLPFVLLVLDYWPLNRMSAPARLSSVGVTLDKSSGPPLEGPASESSTQIDPEPSAGFQFSTLPRLLLEKAPFFLLAVLSCWITMIAQTRGKAVVSQLDYPLEERFLNTPVGYTWYVLKLFWPVHLSTPYPLLSNRPLWMTLGSFAVMAVLTVWAFMKMRKHPWVTGWFLFAGMLVPVCGLVQVGNQSYADRYTYLPYIGLFIMLAWGIPELFEGRRRGPFLLGTAVALFSIACLIRTSAQIRYWKDTQTLFTHSVRLNPANCIAWFGLGVDWMNKGDPDEAIKCYEKAIASNPLFFEPRSNLGLAYYNKGEYAKSQAVYEETLKLSPNEPDLHNNLAASLYAGGKLEEAIAEYNRTLQLAPTHSKARYNLAGTLFAAGKPAEAVRQFRHLAERDPSFVREHPDLHVQFGQALAANGESAEAEQQFNEALRWNPRDGTAEFGLAMVLESTGHMGQAALHYRQALALNPKQPMALNNFAWLLATCSDAALRDGPEAVRRAEQACELTSHKQAVLVGTLAAAYAEAGRFSDAIKTAEAARGLALAEGKADIAQRNSELLELYRAGKPYHESPVTLPSTDH